MKRFHVHLSVRDLAESTAFYTRLFGSAPAVSRPDYAKWMLDDPRLNFAISAHGRAGLDHFGLQAEGAGELADIRTRFAAAGAPVSDEPASTCCYALSDKHWTVDPQGVAWEAFHTLGEALRYGEDRGKSTSCDGPTACCAP